MARDVERNAPDGLETLAAHAGGLRALAFELVGDPHAAEDVLQDTFVRALARPPTGASSAGLRAWLREVVRGLALNHRRNAAHRSEREAAYARASAANDGARSPAGPAHEAAERGEALRRVVAAVLALDEPYKTVVLLRYFEGLSPAEIAARTNTPLATVASRLQRAHQKLRGELERGPGGLAFALAPFLGRHALPFAPHGGLTSPIAKGIVVMGTKSIVGVGALVLALVCWWLFSLRTEAPLAHEGPALAAASPASELASAALDTGSEARPARDGAARASATEVVSSAATPPDAADGAGPFEFEVELLVVDAAGFPQPDVEVDAAPDGQPLAEFGATAWNGRLVKRWRGFESNLDLVVRAKSANAGDTDLRHLRLASGVKERSTLALPGLARRGGESTIVFRALTVSGTDGSFVVSGSPASPSTEFELDEHGNGVWEDSFLYDPEPVVPVLGELPILDRLFVSSAGVHLQSEIVFTLDSLRVEGLSVLGAGVEPAPKEPEPETFALRGTLRGASGGFAAEMPVTLLAATGETRRQVVTDAQGAFVFEGCKPGPAVVCAGGPGLGIVVHEFALAPALPELELALEDRGTLFVRLVDETGAPLSGWRVEAWADPAERDFVRGAQSGDDGRATLFDVGAAPLWLTARATNEAGALVPAKRVAERVWAQKDELVLPVPGGARLARLAFTLATATGLPAEGAIARLEREDGVAAVPVRSHSEGEGEAARPVWSLAGVVPGRYRLVAGAPGETWMDLGPVELRPGDDSQLGEHRFAPRAKLGVAFVAETAAERSGDEHAQDAFLPGHRERADARLVVLRQGAVVRSREFSIDLPGTLGIPPGASHVDWTRRSALHAAPDGTPPAAKFDEAGTAETRRVQGRSGATTKLELAPLPAKAP